MYLFTVALTVAGVSLVSAAPAPAVQKRTGVTDADILNYALTLEHLEDTFYRQGLAEFNQQDFAAAGFDATFYANLQEVASDESNHVSFLTNALTAAGATPVAECTYDFGYTDVVSFLATASVLEGVGVSAYLGAAASIASKSYLTAAGSILTVEARHSAYLRANLGESPYPQSFDTPLSLDEVYSLASSFIKSCPKSNPALPVKAFPALTLAPPAAVPVKAGDTVVLLAPNWINASALKYGKVYVAFIGVTGPVFAEATPAGSGFSAVIPPGFAGQTYVVLNGGNTAVTDDSVAAGPAIIEIST
ncbi:Ferritin/ribonucleotide reductase-like protein [Xylariales sp. PMI_506]|nr:Ferritin/ribonucleotide reductase-like protein [Xylariales sp. PMI_506]